MNPKKTFVVMMALVVAIFVISLATAFAQVDTAWVRRYNGPGNSDDGAYGIAVDDSGNVYVTGYSAQSPRPSLNFDYATIKYLPNGNVASGWPQRYNGPGNSWDEAVAIAVDDSNNVYVTGRSAQDSTYPLFNWDYTTIKYLPNGNVASGWPQRYNGPGNSWDGAFAIAVDGSGNVYVTGYSYDSTTYDDYTTIKYLPNGNVALGWPQRYNGPGNSDDFAYDIAVDGSGNVYVTGSSVTIKYDANGNQSWVGVWGGGSLALDTSNNVYVTGSGWDSVTSDDYVRTIKYYADGDTAWVRRYYGPGNDYDYGYAITVDDSGNVYVTGTSYGSGTEEDYVTIKYLPNGNIASGWPQRYNGPGNSSDEPYGIAVDDSGNVYVTGYSCGGTVYDYSTIKYRPNGDTAWVRTYDGPGHRGDEATAIAIDDSGNVYVTGRSSQSPSGYSNYDYATIKYIPRDISITVISPNGGEVWCADSIYTINWTSFGVPGKVKIEYSSHREVGWITIVDSTENDGEYQWVIPHVNSSTCLVRICALSGQPCDTSDSNFTITSVGIIQVTSPNGEEIWCIDSTYEITWDHYCFSRDVSIYYSTDSGQNWRFIEDQTENDGSYLWVVPPPASRWCKVKVCDYIHCTEISDFSDTTFVISLTCQIPVLTELGIGVLLILLTATAVWMIKRKRLALERNN